MGNAVLRINRVRRVAPEGSTLLAVCNRYGMAIAVPLEFAERLRYAKVYQDRAGAFWYKNVLGHQELLQDLVGKIEIMPAKSQ